MEEDGASDLSKSNIYDQMIGCHESDIQEKRKSKIAVFERHERMVRKNGGSDPLSSLETMREGDGENNGEKERGRGRDRERDKERE
ncbi:hypothetical protein ACLOJK_035889 [Asimina triloba]